MKLTLMIEGSASVLATILAALPKETEVAIATHPIATIAPAPVAVGVPQMPNLSGAADDSDGDDEGGAVEDAPAADSTGLPWDARIHASNKARNGDGTWRKRRKVQQVTVDAVEAELRGAVQVAIPANPVPLPVAITAPPMPVLDVAHQQMPTPVMPVMTPAAPMPTPVMPAPVMAMPTPAPEPAPQPVAPAAMDFTALMGHIAVKMQQQAFDPSYLVDLVARVNAAYVAAGQAGISSITDLQQVPDRIGYVVQTMQADGKW